jgi:hypothetical protein
MNKERPITIEGTSHRKRKIIGHLFDQKSENWRIKKQFSRSGFTQILAGRL